MAIKKIAQPINKAKNNFVKWLKDNNAESIDVFDGKRDDDWDYYRTVSAFVGETFYSVNFMIWNGDLKIDCFIDGENRYKDLSIEDFNELIK